MADELELELSYSGDINGDEYDEEVDYGLSEDEGAAAVDDHTKTTNDTAPPDVRSLFPCLPGLMQ